MDCYLPGANCYIDLKLLNGQLIYYETIPVNTSTSTCVWNVKYDGIATLQFNETTQSERDKYPSGIGTAIYRIWTE